MSKKETAIFGGFLKAVLEVVLVDVLAALERRRYVL